MRAEPSRELAWGSGAGRWDGLLVALAYHDDPSGLLRRAHAHDGRHADGGPLEINPTGRQKKGVS